MASGLVGSSSCCVDSSDIRGANKSCVFHRLDRLFVGASGHHDFGVGRGDARIAGHLFYPYFVDVFQDGYQAAVAASELGAALSALMHHSKYSNITTFESDALNKLIVRCVDKVERGESVARNLQT